MTRTPKISTIGREKRIEKREARGWEAAWGKALLSWGIKNGDACQHLWNGEVQGKIGRGWPPPEGFLGRPD